MKQKNHRHIGMAPNLCWHSWQNVHSYESTIYVCNVIGLVISVFKALQKHQLTTHDNYNYNFVIFAYTRPPYWTELNLLLSSVQFGRKANRKRVCGSLNRTSQNHNGSEPNRTGNGQNYALRHVYGRTKRRICPFVRSFVSTRCVCQGRLSYGGGTEPRFI